MLQTQSSISSTNNGLSGTYPCCLYLVTSQIEHGERHKFDPKPLQHFSKPDYRKLLSARAELGQMETALAKPALQRCLLQIPCPVVAFPFSCGPSMLSQGEQYSRYMWSVYAVCYPEPPVQAQATADPAPQA